MEDFASRVNAFFETLPEPSEFQPYAYHNVEGDCLEIVVSPDKFKAIRINGAITIYRDYRSGEVVGALIKGVKNLLQRLHEKLPGIEIMLDEEKTIVLTVAHAPFLITPPPPEGITSLREMFQDLNRVIGKVRRMQIEGLHKGARHG